MGVGKSRVEAKRCSCDELAKPDSLNAVVRTRVSCRSSDSKNHNRKSSNPTRDATKKRSLHHKNDYHKFPNKHVQSPSKPRVNNNNEYQCYTALKGQRYSVDALTPEEQFEEVEKVFCEKKIGRAPTQINRRPSQSNRQVSSTSARESAGNASETTSLTDTTRAYMDDSPSFTATRRGCNPDCRCGGNKSSAQPTLVIERRNGLQKVGHSNAGCQCVLYDGRVGRLHEAELSQAQAIAIAVREYCAQRRKSGRGHGHYCLCSKDVLPKPQWQEDEELERESQRKNEEKYLGRKDLEKEENETEDDIEDDVEEGKDEDEGERVENVEWAAEIEERRKSRAEYDELFADEQRELEKYLPETRRRLHDSEQIDPESGKRSRRRNEKDSSEFTDQDAFSLSDVELQVQTVVSTTPDNPRHAPTKPQGRQPPNNNTAQRSSDAKQNRQRHEKLRLSTLTADEKDCKCCSCGTKELGELEIAHEEEVIVKETNLSPRSPHEIKSESTKPKRELPPGRIESKELRAGRAYRRVSTESAIESSSLEEDCKCCDCDKATMTDWTDVDRRTKSEKTYKNFDIKLTQDHEPRQKEYVARARRSTENETEHERVKSSQAKWEPKDAYAIAATQFNKEGHKREKVKLKCCCRSSEDDAEKDLKPCCPCKKDDTTASDEKHSDERTESESDSAHKMHSTERITGRSAERKSHSNNRQRKKSNASDGDRRRSYVRRRSRSKSEKECQTYCRCKKTKGVPLTKCCKCHEEFAYSAAHQQDEDMKRRKLAEELADRIQRRAELQIALQKRLQEQRRAKQKQYCCCDPPPCCFPLYKCCEMQAPEPISVYDATQKSPYCCCPSPPCCHTTTCGPPCCCEPAPCFGQDCPCCCQPLKYCYPPSCAYPRTGL